ncbi:MAG: Re/Si-specific NAD(P)(+) transhydrogenase subunit alpha [Alphaproteobacteria bacterium]|nr:Re/Si-specific NAD(P)(+) transhydrogenase subunit alpha [Alphaproteobacteria bacterium]TAD87846.1 MAG: Re/Si-specific NAD(P)(+) transhydrogenase subunit alpha [Alphaproteobacteria bacterium]
MKVAVLKERRAYETRVAATPESVKKLLAMGASVMVEAGAGLSASIPDAAYEAAGASIGADAAATLTGAGLVLKVQRPLAAGEGEIDELSLIPAGAALVAGLAPYQAGPERYAERSITAFALELVPRITRAQSMDILSSQANLAGYRAVLEAAAVYGRSFPMMMTAAGTVAPAKVLVLGAGVAGLQAIATARRLGAIVSAFDVRAAAKEQVQSLGATFVEVEGMADAETKGGYAKELDDATKQRQTAKIAETLKKTDIAISTALIPGRPAPRLITAGMVHAMRPGSVIVDLAVETGGNCELSRLGEIHDENGVKIVGLANLPGRLPAESSALFARNIVAFLQPILKDGALTVDTADEVIAGSLLTRDGAVVHPSFKPKPADASAAPEASQ